MTSFARGVCVALAVLVSACAKHLPDASSIVASSDASREASSVPAIATRSPDDVVKSYWAIQDWARDNLPRVFPKLQFNDEFRRYSDARRGLAAGEYLASLDRERQQLENLVEPSAEHVKRVIQRDILEVKNESETRAIVFAKVKNVTPLPADMKFSLYEKLRNYGYDVKYVVEKTDSGWRLSQAWRRDASDIELDDASPAEKRNGGWQKVWETPQPSTGPSEFEFAWVDP